MAFSVLHTSAIKDVLHFLRNTYNEKSLRNPSEFLDLFLAFFKEYIKYMLENITLSLCYNRVVEISKGHNIVYYRHPMWLQWSKIAIK